MKYLKNYIASLLLIASTVVVAQESPSEVTKEVTKKTLKIHKDGTVVENSIKISTEIRQAVMTDPEDNGKVNGDRIFPPKVVVKTVEIDNDSDDMYDEKIKFSYTTKERTDFTLVTNKNDIMIAVEDGDNVSILENQKMFKPSQKDKTSYIYTDEEGGQIEFRIENNMTTESK